MGGNPAKRICSVEEFASKREAKQAEEAYILYKNYVHHFKTEPKEELFFEFIALFTDFSKEENVKKYEHRLKLMNNEDMTVSYLKNHQPKYQSYAEMLKDFALRYQTENKS